MATIRINICLLWLALLIVGCRNPCTINYNELKYMSELSLQSIDTLLKSKNYILGNDQLRGNDRAINYFCGSNRNEADQIQIFKYPHSFNMVSYITTDIEYSRKLKIDIFNKGFVYYRTIKDTNYTIGCYRKGKFIVGLSQYSIGNIWHYSHSIQKEN